MNTYINFEEKNNLYKILEINNNSSDVEIKKAWKKLALKYHPDKNNNKTSEKFIKIKYAYEILSNKFLKNKYDNQMNQYKNISIFNFEQNNLKKYFTDFIGSTEIEKFLYLILNNKVKLNNLFNISYTNKFYEFFEMSKFDLNVLFKKLTDIIITIDWDLKDVWNLQPKIIKYIRQTKKIFEEIIYPIDFEQIYEYEGEELIINNISYKGDLIIKINIVNTSYNNENYYIFNEDLYIIIDYKRIINDNFKLHFLDDNKYKFNVKKLQQINNTIGKVYFKRYFGFPKYLSNNTNIINTEEIYSNIIYSNLYFIIILN